MRTHLAVILSFFICLSAVAQNNIFYGLKLGEKYTSEQIIQAVGEEYFVKMTEPSQQGSVCYYFEDISYKGEKYPRICFNTLGEGVLVTVAFIHLPREGYTTSLGVKYLNLKYSLMLKYDMEEIESSIPGTTRLFGKIDDDITVSLLKYEADGGITAISEEYASKSATERELIRHLQSKYPKIQDTFFGLHFGDVVTRSKIESAIGQRGKFLDDRMTAMGHEITFTSVNFAGRVWNYGVFTVSNSGIFYTFTVYDRFDDGYINDDERLTASKTYDSIKSRLESKYAEGSFGEEEEDGGKSVAYRGSNNVAISLSNSRSKSAGGSYLRYVTLYYYQTEIGRSISKSSDDEL